jgi:hypothetical protein
MPAINLLTDIVHRTGSSVIRGGVTASRLPWSGTPAQAETIWPWATSLQSGREHS